MEKDNFLISLCLDIKKKHICIMKSILTACIFFGFLSVYSQTEVLDNRNSISLLFRGAISKNPVNEIFQTNLRYVRKIKKNSLRFRNFNYASYWSI